MQIPQISAPSAGETIRVAGRGTRRIADSAATGNVQGRNTQLAGLFDLLMGGGATLMDPALRAEFDATQSSVAAATKGPLKEIGKLETLIANLSSKGTLTKAQQNKLTNAQTKLADLQSRVSTQNQRLTDFQNNRLAGAPNAVDMLREKFPELGQTAADAEPYLQRMGQLGATGERLMDALGQGFQSREVGRGAAGEALYGRATEMASSDGRLSPEAARDAVQSARQAFSARGLGTSAGSAAAELLNRDSYSRQRMFQDLGFANQISQQDQQRLFGNEQNRMAGTELNNAMLGQAFTTDRMVNQEGLGAALQRGQLAGAANPYNMLLGMYGQGNPTGSESINAGATLANNWANNRVQTDMFNANAQMWGNYANKYGGGSNFLTGSALGDFALNKGVDIGTKVLFG